MESLLHIRQCTPRQDFPRILEIEGASFTSERYSEHTFWYFYRRCPDLFIVAEYEQTILGYLICCIYLQGRKQQRRGHLVSIAVDPLYRRRGIGKALVQYTFDRLETLSVAYVEIEVRIDNDVGLNFWEGFGFQKVGTIPRYYGDGCDGYRMLKYFDVFKTG
jgi:ribosomal protein S18 acetylase RimI-like enzyme